MAPQLVPPSSSSLARAEVLQYLISHTDRSPIQREQVATLLRQRVMTAIITAAPVGLGVQVSAPQPSQPPAMASMPLVEPPKFSGFKDLQSPEYSLERAFASLDEFTQAFRTDFTSIDSKHRLKEDLQQRTQHHEENVKEFIDVVLAYYGRTGEPVTEEKKVQRFLRQIYPQLQDLTEASTFTTLKKLAAVADRFMQRAWWLGSTNRCHYQQIRSQGPGTCRPLTFSDRDQCQ
ncbi:hypothetical protein HPB52_022352 [Rhipicephalus sanguineus]|uniref:Retrotransposon gag domain-containing protein n=1 Tax=Rhipicephalus sanguineus TaxID=34632 RepID=A0A9D4Q827_RHISA|nr:hypothetical protein HPB52_022352 [Rhipicephalus sanguineus]